jgi:hypothetical protein
MSTLQVKIISRPVAQFQIMEKDVNDFLVQVGKDWRKTRWGFPANHTASSIVCAIEYVTDTPQEAS